MPYQIVPNFFIQNSKLKHILNTVFSCKKIMLIIVRLFELNNNQQTFEKILQRNFNNDVTKRPCV